MALYEHLDKVPKPHAKAISIVDLTFGMNVQVSWLRPFVKHAAMWSRASATTVCRIAMAACCLTSTILLLRSKSYRKLWAEGRL